ncbi:hypothetical protein BJF78_19410 [Pseudonocardia sp. CNS-139]|nr:hypothetical protein BJF78_19410 [Pseudonocardia sp. CNS-139]
MAVPAGTVSDELLAGPSVAHPLGTDNIGRDVLSGILEGARVSLLTGFAAAALSLLIGVGVGSVAGYFEGWAGGLLMRVAELFQVLPSMVMAIVAVAIIGPSTGVIVCIIALTMWPETSRVVRAQFLTFKEREFVESARSVGFGPWYIIAREILPNALPAAVIVGTLGVGRGILVESGLSYLGLGDPNAASWGQMLNRAQPYLSTAWWMSVFPGVAILLVVLAVNLCGDALNDRLNQGDRR